MSKGKLSVVFIGTPEFSCPSLEKLAEKEKVVAVVTQPDKPRGRGKKISPPPVKVKALQKNIPVYQPDNLNKLCFLEKIEKLRPDLIVVVAFGKILPGKLLNIPKFFPINLHPSLLPKYRGPAPVPWAIIKGEKYTGITVQKMTEKVDEGEIILQKKVLIAANDTSDSLSKKLSHIGAEALIEAIDLIKKGKIDLRPQVGKASYAPKIKKDMGKINWEKSAREIHNLVRGLNSFPGAFTEFFYRERFYSLKIWETEILENFSNNKKGMPGSVVKIIKDRGFIVKTGKGYLLVKKVQLPGKSKIDAYDFIKGYHVKEGFTLGG